ncbi:hypothetical protein FDP41_007125 [Naegleria fowleri]|uniref:Uncharacterized protein n=1 Tax=Naegleria fowleri TaxID=5763 RepID=A0A6A5BI57_NAEFO|nr:uncharacterized protein FDP41_007125 [Naegleria fowleri]KAF0973738.1 hypothetical protein FDP41_007125 [Naegleria fowleri]
MTDQTLVDDCNLVLLSKYELVEKSTNDDIPLGIRIRLTLTLAIDKYTGERNFKVAKSRIKRLEVFKQIHYHQDVNKVKKGPAILTTLQGNVLEGEITQMDRKSFRFAFVKESERNNSFWYSMGDFANINCLSMSHHQASEVDDEESLDEYQNDYEELAHEIVALTKRKKQMEKDAKMKMDAIHSQFLSCIQKVMIQFYSTNATAAENLNNEDLCKEYVKMTQQIKLGRKIEKFFQLQKTTPSMVKESLNILKQSLKQGLYFIQSKIELESKQQNFEQVGILASCATQLQTGMERLSELNL